MVSKSTPVGGKDAALSDSKTTTDHKTTTEKKELATDNKVVSAKNNAKATGATRVAEVEEIQAMIDRIKNLQRLPQRSAKAEAEIVSLTKRLKALAKKDKNALKYFRQGKEGSVFIARYLSVCRKCRRAVDIGETAVYINSAIICSKCGIG